MCRDVGLNLRIVNNTTMELGLETHVCEVQLLLYAFAELKVLLSAVTLNITEAQTQMKILSS